MLVGRIEGYFNGVLRGFQGYLKELKRMSERSHKCVSREFQDNLNEDLGVF